MTLQLRFVDPNQGAPVTPIDADAVDAIFQWMRASATFASGAHDWSVLGARCITAANETTTADPELAVTDTLPNTSTDTTDETPLPVQSGP